MHAAISNMIRILHKSYTQYMAIMYSVFHFNIAATLSYSSYLLIELICQRVDNSYLPHGNIKI